VAQQVLDRSRAAPGKPRQVVRILQTAPDHLDPQRIHPGSIRILCFTHCAEDGCRTCTLQALNSFELQTFHGRKTDVVRSSKLPKRELEICHRLREAREALEHTHTKVASQINLPPTTLINYEIGRTPVRFDVALRFCRQFFVSEEWLATGRHDSMIAAAQKQPLMATSVREDPELRSIHDEIFFYQSLDLLSHPVCHQIPVGTLFSDAFDNFLAPVYRALALKHFYAPPFSFTVEDNAERRVNFFHVMFDRYATMIGDSAKQTGRNPEELVLAFDHDTFRQMQQLFLEMMQAMKSPPSRASKQKRELSLNP